jgi:hypothetical protein
MIGLKYFSTNLNTYFFEKYFFREYVYMISMQVQIFHKKLILF